MKKKYLEGAQRACEVMGASGERVLAFAIAFLPFEEFPKEFKFAETAVKDEIKFNFPMVQRQCMSCQVSDITQERLTFVGLLSLMDPPRPTVPLAIAQLNQAGIRVIMVTGDHPVTAAVRVRLSLHQIAMSDVLFLLSSSFFLTCVPQAIAKSVGIIDQAKPVDKILDLGKTEVRSLCLVLTKYRLFIFVVYLGSTSSEAQDGRRRCRTRRSYSYATTKPLEMDPRPQGARLRSHISAAKV